MSNGFSDRDCQINSSGYVESATINLTFYQRNTRIRNCLNLKQTKAEQNNDVLQFQWKSPEDKISFNLNAQVKTTNSIVQIKILLNTKSFLMISFLTQSRA